MATASIKPSPDARRAAPPGHRGILDGYKLWKLWNCDPLWFGYSSDQEEENHL